MKDEQRLNPSQHIKNNIENGNYFNDSKSWFYQKYISPYKTRLNLLVILITIFVIIVFFSIQSINSVLFTTAKNGVAFLEGADFEDEFVMEKIPKYYNNNEKNILRFIIENYVNYFESYDINKFNLYALNEKIRKIQENSSKSVGEKFQNIVRNNYTAEIFSGLTRTSQITSFQFIEQDNSFKQEVIRFILPEKVSNKVRISLTSKLYAQDKSTAVIEEKRNIEITFSYTPLEKNKESQFEPLNFKVTSYNYI